MAIQTIENINVDFYDNKYILINAKQYDNSSRWISITCYNQGDLFNLSANKHSAYVKFRKADGHGVLNSCKINARGEVLVELTEQMLAAGGICYVDLTIINKGHALVNVDTGDIVAIDDTPILSTMAFCVNVYETVVDNSDIESSYEYNALNDLMQRAESDYTEVIKLAKSYAVGDANEIRDGEDEDNSKYYSRLSRSYAVGDANGIRDGEDTDNSKYYSEQSAKSAEAAKNSEENAESYMNTTNEYMTTTDGYMKTTESYMDSSESYMNTTNEYMTTTKEYMDNAKKSETNAATSESNAYDYSITSQRYAVGGTNTVENEDVDNAMYYYQQTKGISDSVSGALSPKGTVSFSELATIDKFTGYMYVINESFTTDDTFAEGAGIEYQAGTIVYYTVDGKWACFDGLKSDIATVNEVIDYLDLY